MNLLYPAALALAAALAVPLLLHLRRRPTRRRIPFPALRYLRRAERSLSKALKVRDLVLMALRVGVVALAALAAAGPLVGRGEAGQHGPTDVAIVLDNSASTSRLEAERLVFDGLREAALAAIELAGPSDRFWIFPTVGGPLALGVGSGDADRALRRAQPSDGFGDLSGAVWRAIRSLPDSEAGPRDRAREVHLLSDLQATGLTAAANPGPAIPLIVYRGPAGNETNGAITGAALSEGAAPPSGAPLFVYAELALHPRVAGTGDSALVRLEVDGATVAAVSASWEEQVTFRVPGLDAGDRYALIEIEPSGLRADDSRHLILRTRDAPPVELLASEGSFLDLALQTLREAGRIGSAGSPVRILEFGPERLPVRRTEDGLPAAVVYIPPADPVELPRVNQRLAEASVPWALSAEEEKGALALSATGRPAGASLALDAVRVFQRYRLTPKPEATSDSVLIRSSDGSPWLVRGRAQGSVYLIVASPLLPSASTLPTSAAMVPFVERLTQWAVVERVGRVSHHAGDIVELPPRADSVQTPDSFVRRVDGRTPIRLLKAGLYRIFRNGTIELMAANVPEEEHDLSAVDANDLPELFPGLEVVTAGPGAGRWARQTFRQRRGRDATAWIVGIVGLLVLIETLVATPGASDPKSRP